MILSYLIDKITGYKPSLKKYSTDDIIQVTQTGAYNLGSVESKHIHPIHLVSSDALHEKANQTIDSL